MIGFFAGVIVMPLLNSVFFLTDTSCAVSTIFTSKESLSLFPASSSPEMMIVYFPKSSLPKFAFVDSPTLALVSISLPSSLISNLYLMFSLPETTLFALTTRSSVFFTLFGATVEIESGRKELIFLIATPALIVSESSTACAVRRNDVIESFSLNSNSASPFLISLVPKKIQSPKFERASPPPPIPPPPFVRLKSRKLEYVNPLKNLFV